MDISALVHRHADAVVIPACRICYIYLLCFALMTFLFPQQLGAMDDSDEELQLINDVARFDSQLKQAWLPLRRKSLCPPFQRFECETIGEEIEAMALQKSAKS
jgi:hypothetical protein